MRLGLYCVYCAEAFLNAASVIAYYNKDGSYTLFEERGHSAVEKLAAIKDEVESSGGQFRMIINAQTHENMLYASVMVGGTSVCTVHLYDATGVWWMRGRR